MKPCQIHRPDEFGLVDPFSYYHEGAVGAGGGGARPNIGCPGPPKRYKVTPLPMGVGRCMKRMRPKVGAVAPPPPPPGRSLRTAAPVQHTYPQQFNLRRQTVVGNGKAKIPVPKQITIVFPSSESCHAACCLRSLVISFIASLIQ